MTQNIVGCLSFKEDVKLHVLQLVTCTWWAAVASQWLDEHTGSHLFNYYRAPDGVPA